MSDPLEVAARRLLNDRVVFPFLYDRDSRQEVKLFDKDSWNSLRAAFQNGHIQTVRDEASSRKGELQLAAKQGVKVRRGEANAFESNVKLAEALVASLGKFPSTLKVLFDAFDTFGCLRTNLPDMEEFGKVAEFEPVPTLRQYFLYKIGRARNDRQKAALKRVLEQVEYLLAGGIDCTHIGFFLRKLESLRLLPEVITNVR